VPRRVRERVQSPPGLEAPLGTFTRDDGSVLTLASRAVTGGEVTHLLTPRVDHTVAYQRYYLVGFEQLGALRVEGLPGPIGAVHGITRQLRALDWWNRIARAAVTRDSGHVGRYLASSPSGNIRFAIDARDNHRILDKDVLDWSDVYFKANRWPDFEYDAKVKPVVNGNGILDVRTVRRLRALRNIEKDVDVAFISRIWGGREHNIRLFEELARLDVRSDLLAILPSGPDAEVAARLAQARVPTQDYMVSADALWQRIARAKVIVIRSGPHLCIPWRALDLLALGSCIVWDADPLPHWPVPLEPEVHWVSAGIERPHSGEPERSEYAKLGAAVERLVGDAARARSLRMEAATYFDAHAAPERVAEYVLGTVRGDGRSLMNT
jgi:hypothetical protein